MRLRGLINLLEQLSENGKNDDLQVWCLELCSENESQVYDARVKINDHGRYIQLTAD